MKSLTDDQWIQAKNGANVAAVALTGKALCIVHHLLIIQEMYQEEEHTNDKDNEIELLLMSRQMCLDEIIRYVTKGGYEVRKRTLGSGG